VHAADPLAPEQDRLCQEISRRLASVPVEECRAMVAASSRDDGRSVQGIPLLWRDYLPVADRTPHARVLLLGGIHGDEYAAISTMFLWMRWLERYHSGMFHWRILPLINPDGLFHTPSQRTNSRGVDLNRNFPTAGWDNESQGYWVQRTGRDPRRYPGPAPLSEPESQWVARHVEQFRPDVILAVHAPLGVVDFDGTRLDPPKRLGPLRLRRMGTYPGSMGQYAGVERNIPVLTIELASATRMPPLPALKAMWSDIIDWMRRCFPINPSTRQPLMHRTP
jgi:hypothetical protein